MGPGFSSLSCTVEMGLGSCKGRDGAAWPEVREEAVGPSSQHMQDLTAALSHYNPPLGSTSVTPGYFFLFHSEDFSLETQFNQKVNIF